MTTRVQNETEHYLNDNTLTHNDTEKRTDVTLKTGEIVQSKDKHSGISHTAKVLVHEGKATGKYRNWYNMLHIVPTDVASMMFSCHV